MSEQLSIDDDEPSGPSRIIHISDNPDYSSHFIHGVEVDTAERIIEAVKELTPPPESGDEWAFRREQEEDGIVFTYRDVFTLLGKSLKAAMLKEINASGIVAIHIPGDGDVNVIPKDLPAGLYSVIYSEDKGYDVRRRNHEIFGPTLPELSEASIDEVAARSLLVFLDNLRSKQSI